MLLFPLVSAAGLGTTLSYHKAQLGFLIPTQDKGIYDSYCSIMDGSGPDRSVQSSSSMQVVLSSPVIHLLRGFANCKLTLLPRIH